tara:strand:- start:12681 stop:12995 length:315 start_codon:yes stop_codon:yes gene_type:complete
MSDSDIETSWGNRTLSVIGGVGFILLFLLILWIAYLPYRPDPISEVQAQTRLQTLQEIRNASTEIITTYGVVNPNEGTYRIPIEEAMKLTVDQYRTSASTKSSE